MNTMENARQEARFDKVERTHQDPAELRSSTRHSVDLDVTMGSDHNFYAGFVENVSHGGIFIATHTRKEVGELIDFTINLPGFDTIRGVGEVRWVRVYSETSNVPPGLGLRFRELAEGAVEMITEFLKSRDPLFYDDE
jgi:uncharacterized protein (TIGR02266 family)